jgi:pimeloyl-ACP methyl ester carboxylesterase
MSGCFNRMMMSDEQIDARYFKKKKPKFESYQYHNRELHFAETGEDTLPIVVFVHGAPGAWYGYIDYLDDSLMQTKYNMISIDRPGYGKSNYGKALTSIAEQARILKPLLERKRKKRKLILVGRSYGCPIVLKAAADYPDLVDGIVLLAPAVDPKREKFWWFSKLANSGLMRAILPRMLNVASSEKFSHALELKILEKDLKKVRQKIVLMQGLKDQVIEPENVCYIDSALTENFQKELIIFDDCDHFISTNKATEVKQAIDKMFLEMDELENQSHLMNDNKL